MTTQNASTITPPNIPGLIFRPVRGPEDAESLQAVHTGRMACDGVNPKGELEDFPPLDYLREELASAVADGRQDQWQVAQVGDQVVGYSVLESWPEDDGTQVYLIQGWVLPEWRGQGIGTALLRWGEERSRRDAAAEHPGAKFEFAANASATEKDATALLANEGYTVGFTALALEMQAATPVPEHPLPAGIAVRAVEPEHYPLIAASVRAAYQAEFEGGRFNEDTGDIVEEAARLQSPRHDPTLWQIAWDGDQIAGQVMSAIRGDVAEVFEVSVRPAWRRRGLARALLSRALRELQARGVAAIHLQTVDEFRTRAKDLYSSVGFQRVKAFPRYRKTV